MKRKGRNHQKEIAILLTVLIVSAVVIIQAKANEFSKDNKEIQKYLDDFVNRIEKYGSGILRYDASFLEPRIGPGEDYPSNYQFDMKEGEEIKVFLKKTDRFGNQWVLAEGNVHGKLMRAYLMYYDANIMEVLIDKNDNWEILEEESKDWETAFAVNINTIPRMGPGDSYQLMEEYFDTGEHRVSIVAVESNWVLVEEIIPDDIYTDTFIRGWVPMESLY